MCAGLMTGCGSNDTKSQFKKFSKCATIDKAAYTDIEYVPASREVSEDDVNSAISSFCSDNSETTEDKTSTVADGDKINVDYVETVSGTEKDSKTDYTLTMGNNTLGDGSDDQLIGSKPGDVKTITVTYPDDYSDTTVAGLTAEYKVTINYISVTTVPEYTDALVKKATDGEYTTTDDYTAHLKEDVQKDKDDSRTRQTELLFSRLLGEGYI
ncbi:MAG: FKBP-type peptidyl-prolyl cis-trans isomerase [Coprococcus sp.]